MISIPRDVETPNFTLAEYFHNFPRARRAGGGHGWSVQQR
tara:strand:+ start:7534 stop:7653 length:120 start_codon:yes stop_codon:yes gene_type:complete